MPRALVHILRAPIAKLALTGLISQMLACDLGSTADDEPPPEDPDPVIWPMSVGNYWELVEEVSPSTIVSKAEVRRSVRRPDGSNGFVVRWLQNGLPVSTVEAVFSNDSGRGFAAIGAMRGDDTLSFNMLFLPFPARVGDAGYGLSYNLPDGDRQELTVVDSTQFVVTNTDTTIVTPVGEFDCYEYTRVLENDGALLDWIVHEYYSPNIGPVKVIVRNEISPRTDPKFVYSLHRARVGTQDFGGRR